MNIEIAQAIAQFHTELILRYLVALIPIIIFIRLIAPRRNN